VDACFHIGNVSLSVGRSRHPFKGPTVFCRPQNVELSYGIYRLPWNFPISAEFDKKTGD